MALTDKQKNILLKNGWSEKDIAQTPYDEASQAIGAILAEPKKGPYTKRVAEPKIETAYRPQHRVFEPSFKVSYAKDLCIAMLNVHAEARKIDNKVEPLEIGKIMHAAVEAIKDAIKEFE